MSERLHANKVNTILNPLDTASDILQYKFSTKESPSTDLLPRLEVAKKLLKSTYLRR